MSFHQRQSSTRDDPPPAAKADPTNYLPTELIHQIFGYIDVNSIESCLLVSRRWRLYSTRARAAKGRKHVKLDFQVVGGSGSYDKTTIQWLWKNDTYSDALEILRTLCDRYSINELSSFEWSFDNSFEADIVKLLAASSPAIINIQLRITGYMDRAVRPNNQVKTLVTKPYDFGRPLICGVLSRISSRTT